MHIHATKSPQNADDVWHFFLNQETKPIVWQGNIAKYKYEILTNQTTLVAFVYGHLLMWYDIIRNKIIWVT